MDVHVNGEFVESVRLSWGGPNSKRYQIGRLPEGRHPLGLRTAVYGKGSKVAIDAFAFESPTNELPD